jgi:riboflavin synthase
LTVWGIGGGAFSVALIPFTLEVTNLRSVEAGRLVNLEADVIAKYVERQLSARGQS